MAFNGRSYHHVAVGGFILNNENKILLIKELRIYDEKEYIRYTVPGGVLENGETIVEGLIREVKEETNLDIKVLGFLGIQNWIRKVEWQGMKVKDGIDIDLYGRLIGGVEKLQSEEGITEIRWVSIDEIALIENEIDYRLLPCIRLMFNKILTQSYLSIKEVNFSRYLKRLHIE